MKSGEGSPEVVVVVEAAEWSRRGAAEKTVIGEAVKEIDGIVIERSMSGSEREGRRQRDIIRRVCAYL